ncbi:amidohydrolase, partial [candidate division WOR-3 bacterium]|nr:amidohydrolase [candidate division WOR-3 bacterium]
MLLLKSGKVHTPEEVRKECDILIDNGKILQIAPNIEMRDAEIIDVSGKIVTPGLIDAHTHVGIYEEAVGEPGADGNEMTDPITPNLRAIDAINPADLAFKDATSAGITALLTGPGSGNIIGGQNIVLKTAGSLIIDERIVRDPAGMKMAMGENPKMVYSGQKKAPSTRMANAALLRESLMKAKDYLRKKEKPKDDNNEVEFDAKSEALIKVLKKEIPIRGHAHRADDIITFIRIKDEFDIDLVIEHGTESHLIADYIAKKGISVVVGPSLSARVKVELKEITFKTPKVLYEKGILFAIMTDAPVLPVNSLPLMVGYSIREGLPWEEGLKAVTINAAKICGVADRIGSLQEGKDADIAVFDGDPFTIEGKCVLTIVNGNIVERI